MEDGEEHIASRSGKVGRPKKYAQPWVSVAKRVYLEAETFSVLRSLKSPYQRQCNSAISDKPPRKYVHSG